MSSAGFVRNGDVAAVRRLLSRGADPNASAGLNDWPPLLHAVHKAQLGTAVALLDGGADVNRPSADGTTALMMAAGYGYGDFAKVLLARGAGRHRPFHALRLPERDGRAVRQSRPATGWVICEMGEVEAVLVGERPSWLRARRPLS